MPLPQNIIDQIKQEAIDTYPEIDSYGITFAHRKAYIAGATAWAEKMMAWESLADKYYKICLTKCCDEELQGIINALKQTNESNKA